MKSQSPCWKPTSGWTFSNHS